MENLREQFGLDPGLKGSVKTSDGFGPLRVLCEGFEDHELACLASECKSVRECKKGLSFSVLDC